MKSIVAQAQLRYNGRMANDRLFLVCEHCGETLMLGKYYPSSGFYTTPGAAGAVEFLDKHGDCIEPRKGELTDVPFTIINEQQLADRSGSASNRTVPPKFTAPSP